MTFYLFVATVVAGCALMVMSVLTVIAPNGFHIMNKDLTRSMFAIWGNEQDVESAVEAMPYGWTFMIIPIVGVVLCAVAVFGANHDRRYAELERRRLSRMDRDQNAK